MLQLYSYGVLLSLGVLCGLYYFWKMGRDEHLEEISLFDAYFLSLLAYFVIGRGGYVYLVSLPILQGVALLTHPGMVVLAGIVGAVITMGIVSRAKGWEFYKIMDITSVSLSLVMIFGSIGSLINGTNVGREIVGRPIPIDVLSICFAVIMFVVTYRVRKNFRFYSWYKGDRGTAPEGLATCTFLLLAGAYYLVRSILTTSFMLPMLIGGISLVGISSLLIYLLSGRKLNIKGVKLIGRRKV